MCSIEREVTGEASKTSREEEEERGRGRGRGSLNFLRMLQSFWTYMLGKRIFV